MVLMILNKRMIAQCATFSTSLNPQNIDNSVSDVRIRFPFESSFWISVSGCKITILPDIQLVNWIVIISDANHTTSLDQRCTDMEILQSDWIRNFFINSIFNSYLKN